MTYLLVSLFKALGHFYFLGSVRIRELRTRFYNKLVKMLNDEFPSNLDAALSNGRYIDSIVFAELIF